MPMPCLVHAKGRKNSPKKKKGLLGGKISFSSLSCERADISELASDWAAASRHNFLAQAARRFDRESSQKGNTGTENSGKERLG